MRHIKKILLSLISFPFLSRIYGCLVNIKRPRWLVNFLIKIFTRKYQINLDVYEKRNFESLADFFVRKLDS